MSGVTETNTESNWCSKIKYSSFREAQGVINYSRKHRYGKDGKRINRLVGKKGKQLQRSYKCDVCGCWHITSQKEWKDV